MRTCCQSLPWVGAAKRLRVAVRTRSAVFLNTSGMGSMEAKCGGSGPLQSAPPTSTVAPGPPQQAVGETGQARVWWSSGHAEPSGTALGVCLCRTARSHGLITCPAEQTRCACWTRTRTRTRTLQAGFPRGAVHSSRFLEMSKAVRGPVPGPRVVMLRSRSKQGGVLQ